MSKKVTFVLTPYVEAVYEDGILVDSGKEDWEVHKAYLIKKLSEFGIAMNDIYTEERYNYEEIPRDLDDLVLMNGLTVEEQRMIDEGMV